jgi:hypothetical protein
VTRERSAYGTITAKALAVMEALLWGFHNAKSGLCFPSYERIHRGRPLRPIDRGGALKALENAGVLSWVHRMNGCARRVLTCWATMGGAGEC